MQTRSASKNPTPIDKTKRIEWIPQAIVKRPVSWFQKHLALEFLEDFDNLDYFEGTHPAQIGIHLYVLRPYRGFPADSVGIYLPNDVSDTTQKTKAIKLIAEKLRLPTSAISWRRAMSS